MSVYHDLAGLATTTLSADLQTSGAAGNAASTQTASAASPTPAALVRVLLV